MKYQDFEIWIFDRQITLYMRFGFKDWYFCRKNIRFWEIEISIQICNGLKSPAVLNEAGLESG